MMVEIKIGEPVWVVRNEVGASRSHLGPDDPKSGVLAQPGDEVVPVWISSDGHFFHYEVFREYGTTRNYLPVKDVTTEPPEGAFQVGDVVVVVGDSPPFAVRDVVELVGRQISAGEWWFLGRSRNTGIEGWLSPGSCLKVTTELVASLAAEFGVEVEG